LATPAVAAPLRVMQWNVKGQQRITIGADGRSPAPMAPLNLARVAGVVVSRHVDLVAFDELCRPQFYALATRLRRAGYPYARHGSAVTRGRCLSGNAVFSHYPFANAGSRRLHAGSVPRGPGPPRPQQRAYLLALRANVGGVPVSVYAFHATGEYQGEEVGRVMDADATPWKVVLCDCNEGPGEPTFGTTIAPLFARGLTEVDSPAVHPPGQNAFARSYFVDTYPVNPVSRWGVEPPRRKIDFVLARPFGPGGFSLGPVSFFQDARISDHRALIADLALDATTGPSLAPVCGGTLVETYRAPGEGDKRIDIGCSASLNFVRIDNWRAFPAKACQPPAGWTCARDGSAITYRTAHPIGVPHTALTLGGYWPGVGYKSIFSATASADGGASLYPVPLFF
jgi:endonuclease/exonuclease/phosphatase family metal-dependent hydrolase